MIPSSHLLAPEQAAIGIFDSGVGGLSVLRSIRRALPHEHLIYVADSGYAPYGDKSTEWIQARSQQIIDFLLSQGCKAIVIACNTASVVAATVLRSLYTLPIIAIEPAIKPAAQQSKNGIIALMATARTVASQQIENLCERYASGKQILLIPCPGLAELVEAGQLEHSGIQQYLHKKLTPALEQKADTLILGCTHYPFLLPQIRAITGPMHIIEPSQAVAAQVQRRLAHIQAHSVSGNSGTLHMWTSASHNKHILRQYLQDPEQIVHTLPEPLLPKNWP